MSISSVDSGPLHVKPEVDLNLAAEANCVLYVLNKVISRAKLAGLLKKFVRDDGFLLRDALDSSTKLKVVEEYQKYSALTSLFVSSESLQSFSKPSKVSVSTSSIDNSVDEISGSESMIGGSLTSGPKQYENKKKRSNSGLIDIIYILEKNPEIRKMAESMEKELSPEMKFFIKCLVEFKNRMEVRLHENAAQYKRREKYMRETYEKNEKAKKDIERLEEELLVTKTDANVCLIGRNILIKRHQNKIEKIQQNSQEVIEKRVHESEKAMVTTWKTSITTQEQLKQDFQQMSEKYSSLLKEHLAIEKVLRTKRAKIENQVLGWIQKFDQDIGEKQAEEEEIQGLLDEETKEVNDIQSKLDEQEEEYDELMQEKALYEEEMLDRRLYIFIMNRSARRIQRSYRLYKARKLAKKSSRRGKKGKKKS